MVEGHLLFEYGGQSAATTPRRVRFPIFSAAGDMDTHFPLEIDADSTGVLLRRMNISYKVQVRSLCHSHEADRRHEPLPNHQYGGTVLASEPNGGTGKGPNRPVRVLNERLREPCMRSSRPSHSNQLKLANQ
jgi:hypothetical protein